MIRIRKREEGIKLAQSLFVVFVISRCIDEQ